MSDDRKSCSKSSTVHANCDTCGQRPEIIHKPAGTGGARYCADCCPACSGKKPKGAADAGRQGSE
jgi:hypothetical protein